MKYETTPDHEQRPVLTQTESRQASSRSINFRVLLSSLVLALIAAAFLYVYFYANTPQPPN
jgi:cytochrome c-type biogenesis protein CcmH/NrfG